MEIRFERRHHLIFLILSTLVHLSGLICFGTALTMRTYYEVHFKSQDLYKKFAYNFKYAVSINALVQTLYNLFAVALDVIMCISYTSDVPFSYYLVRSYFRGSIAFPIGVAIPCTAASLEAISQDSLLNADDSTYPIWLVYTLYGVSPVFLILDIVVCKGSSTNVTFSVILMGTFCVVYFSWVHIVYFYTHKWILSVFKDMSLIKRMVTFFLIFLIFTLSYLLGRLLNDILWDDENFLFMRVNKEKRRSTLKEQDKWSTDNVHPHS